MFAQKMRKKNINADLQKERMEKVNEQQEWADCS